MAKNNKKSPLVSVVIPSWNSEKQLKQNLRFVYAAASEVSAEIVIVDDASSYDKSLEYLKTQEKEGKIRLYKNSENKGFSYTVNRGVSLAKGDYIMLLNTDVRPKKDCFINALKLFSSKEHKDLYAVTFNSGEAWMGGEWKDGLFHHFKVEPNKQNENSLNPSLWASGGQAAFSREKWIELGGMDLLYKPFYWEDTDMGYRAWKRGWEILWDPASKCVHDHEKSVIASNFSKKFVTDTAQRNQFLFIWKNIEDKGMLINHLLHLPYYAVKYPLPFIKAALKLPAVLSRRREELRLRKKYDKEILELWKR